MAVGQHGKQSLLASFYAFYDCLTTLPEQVEHYVYARSPECYVIATFEHVRLQTAQQERTVNVDPVQPSNKQFPEIRATTASAE